MCIAQVCGHGRAFYCHCPTYNPSLTSSNQDLDPRQQEFKSGGADLKSKLHFTATLLKQECHSTLKSSLIETASKQSKLIEDNWRPFGKMFKRNTLSRASTAQPPGGPPGGPEFDICPDTSRDSPQPQASPKQAQKDKKQRCGPGTRLLRFISNLSCLCSSKQHYKA
jgi:hypothetical protein